MRIVGAENYDRAVIAQQHCTLNVVHCILRLAVIFYGGCALYAPASLCLHSKLSIFIFIDWTLGAGPIVSLTEIQVGGSPFSILAEWIIGCAFLFKERSIVSETVVAAVDLSKSSEELWFNFVENGSKW